MSTNKIKIGTRGSSLALQQAHFIKQELEKYFPDHTFELHNIKTTGDKILDTPLAKIGDKGLFTKEIETELLAGSIDLAVHSMKDMPTKLPEGLTIGAVTSRLDVRDAFIGRDGKLLKDLKDGDIVATSSLRRKSQLLAIKPGLSIIDIRGNVNTRIQKMNENRAIQGIILAYAGLKRLNMLDVVSELIDPEYILPAVGQASLAIEIRDNDEKTRSIISPLNHAPSMKAIFCERQFLRVLEGGCQVPIAAYATASPTSLKITGMIASLDGKELYRHTMTGNPEEYEQLGSQLAEYLLKAGGRGILDMLYLDRC